MLLAVAKRLAPLGCIVAALVAAGPARAATTFRPNRFDDPIVPAKSCTPPAPANGCSLRGAVESAQAGDTVQLETGTYTLERGSLKLPKKITIVGAGPGATTIQQKGLDRVIEIENQAGLTMSGVTITGGHLVGQAGGNGASAGEEGKPGEGVYGAGIDAGGAVSLTDVVITGNKAFGGDGGNGAAGTSGAGGKGGAGGYADGVGIDGGSSLTLVRVTVSGNTAQGGDGGVGGNGGSSGPGGAGGAAGTAVGVGISMGNGTLTMVDSAVTDNHGASGKGGNGGLGGTISGVGGAGGAGEASDGGGLFSNGSVSLTNVTFSGNSVSGAAAGNGGAARSSGLPTAGGAGGVGWGGAGGAMALMNGAAGVKAQFASVTIEGNSAGAGTPGTGGAGSDGGAKGASGNKLAPEGGNLFVYSYPLTIRDTIVAGGQAESSTANCSVRGGGTLVSAGHNLDDGHQCIAAPKAGDLLNTPPGLGPLADNGGPTQTMALLAGSAAIGAGEPSCLDAAGNPLATDQRGLPRFSPCDIGAFQVQPAPPPPPPSGQNPAPSSPPKPASSKVVLSGLKLTPGKARAGQKETVSFQLSAGAKLSFALERRVPGVKAGGKCVARSPRARSAKPCRRWAAAAGAPGAFSGAAGPNAVRWTPRRLPPGRYRLTASPAGGDPAAITFSALPPAKAAGR